MCTEVTGMSSTVATQYSTQKHKENEILYRQVCAVCCSRTFRSIVSNGPDRRGPWRRAFDRLDQSFSLDCRGILPQPPRLEFWQHLLQHHAAVWASRPASVAFWSNVLPRRIPTQAGCVPPLAGRSRSAPTPYSASLKRISSRAAKGELRRWVNGLWCHEPATATTSSDSTMHVAFGSSSS